MGCSMCGKTNRLGHLEGVPQPDPYGTYLLTMDIKHWNKSWDDPPSIMPPNL